MSYSPETRALEGILEHMRRAEEREEDYREKVLDTLSILLESSNSIEKENKVLREQSLEVMELGIELTKINLKVAKAFVVRS